MTGIHQTHDFETVVGLEVHLQFKTVSKLFCGCANAFGREPNSCVCPVCLGLPGTLPMLNRAALESAFKTAMALNCELNAFVKFDRKNYFYPDLPKGFQISQYDFPVGYNGFLKFLSVDQVRTVRIHRAHLEEDAGKLIHDPGIKASLVDYNRTGTPLMEIVTEPDIRSPQEAYDYLTGLKLLLEYLDVSDCDMEKGSLRCDANISIRPRGAERLGVKTELKNMNSFKAVKAALEYEERRQRDLVVSGGQVQQETRLWNEARQATALMRTKEEAHDYRYFPEPDLVPFTLDAATLERIRASLPELPLARRDRLVSQYGISPYEAQIMVSDRGLADFFEACCREWDNSKKIVNWTMGPLLKELKERKVPLADLRLTAVQFVELVQAVETGTISNLAGKEILPLLFGTGRSVAEVIAEAGLGQVSDEASLEKIVDDVVRESADVVAQIRAGNAGAMGFLIGQAMKRSQGKANPKKISELMNRRVFHA